MTNNELQLMSETDHGSQPTEFNIILRGGDIYTVPPSDIEFLQACYPAVDVRDQLLRMVGWSWGATEKKRWTKRGVKRGINGWLNRTVANTHTPKFQRARIDTQSTRETTIENDLTDRSWAL